MRIIRRLALLFRKPVDFVPPESQDLTDNDGSILLDNDGITLTE